mmetsp:Transcript_21754/g.39982  ORF Transcript_21754/g.39982 Transcript_21754/m.39982 type:complete len:330 (+) Transcript_21754:95-1084(+)
MAVPATPGTTILVPQAQACPSDANPTRTVLPTQQTVLPTQQTVLPTQQAVAGSGQPKATLAAMNGGVPQTTAENATQVARSVTQPMRRVAAPSAAQAKNNNGMERRVAWLDEDVAKLQARYQEACEGFADDPTTRQMILALTSELAAERHAREMLEIRLTQLEDAVLIERNERQSQLDGFSADIEKHMKALIARIDDGLNAGAVAMCERSDATEDRLRTLIKRVDEGLSAGAAALQDTLQASGALGMEGSMLAASLSQRGSRCGSPQVNINNNWRSQGGTPALSSRGVLGKSTPSSAVPSTLQVPGSGLKPGVLTGGGFGGSPRLAPRA